MTDTKDGDPLSLIAQALADVAALASRPEVAARLGANTVVELRHTAAGYRQRFPDYWPTAQGRLPLV